LIVDSAARSDWFFFFPVFLVISCNSNSEIYLFFRLWICSRAFFDKRISQEVSGDALGEVCTFWFSKYCMLIFYMYAHQLSSGFDRNSRAMFLR
jgi:hypothetical protein